MAEVEIIQTLREEIIEIIEKSQTNKITINICQWQKRCVTVIDNITVDILLDEEKQNVTFSLENTKYSINQNKCVILQPEQEKNTLDGGLWMSHAFEYCPPN